jgi:drug/metabolite transporter (DMT)-like permease
MTRWRADALLLATALIFGLAFIAQKEATGRVGPLAFVAARFALSALVLAPLAAFETRRAAAPMRRRDWGLALAIGLSLFAGSALQQIAMTTASATDAGFLTALYVVLTPFAAWMLTQRRPSWPVFPASAISIAGAWALATNGQTLALGPGDAALLAADVAWALVLALTAMFLERTPRPYTLAFLQYLVCFALGVVSAAAFETTTPESLRATATAIVYAGVVAGGVGFTLQLLALGHTPPSEAALLLSLEGVFAAVAGAAIYSERLSALGVLGCALITGGVLIAEIGPALRAARARPAKPSPGTPAP